MTSQSITFPHLQAIEDNQIDPNNLPVDIKKKITAFKMQFSMYEKSPTENKVQSLKMQSLKIADMIQDYVEKDLPNGGAEPITPNAETPKPVEVPKPVENPEPNPPINGKTDAPTDSDLKAEITKALDRDNRIYHVDLKRIMKKRDLDDVITIDGMVLTRSWGYYSVS